MAACTSGLASNSRKSVVTKSARVLSPTIFNRSCFKSATPMKSTIGWRAATSPRNNPTRPAPTIARPMRLGCFLKRFLQGKIDGQVLLRREIRGDVDLHHHARMLRRQQHRTVERDVFLVV